MKKIASKELEKLKTDECIVAYIDLLGASEAIKNDVDDVNLNTVNYLVHAAQDLCSVEFPEGIGSFKSIVFSDNIVFSHSLGDLSRIQKQKTIHGLLAIASMFQFVALQVGILIRGGISMGDLYLDNHLVWGKALVSSYQLEKTTAIYPRVVVDEDVFEFISKDEDGRRVQCHVEEGRDGCKVLDFCSFIEPSSLDCFYKETLKTLAGMKKSLKKDRRAIQKVIWFESYLESNVAMKKYYLKEAKKNSEREITF